MKTLLIATLMYTKFVLASSLHDDCKNDDNNICGVTFVRIYDADTFWVKIKGTHTLFGGGPKGIAIRVNGVDTPELRTKDKCEKKKGYEAKEVVAKILKKAKIIDLRNVQRGKYFRVVADVYIDGVSIKDRLLKDKLAYAYDGGTKSKVNWCDMKTRLPTSTIIDK